MGVFSKAKKYSKSSLELEEKIKLLENEEKKNIREVMSTANMYSIVEPIPEVPPTPAVMSDVPDPNGVRSPGFTQPDGGFDENDPSTWDNAFQDTSWMLNPNEVLGQTNRAVIPSTTNGQNTVRRFDPGSGLIRAYLGYGPALGYLGAGNVYKGLTYSSYWGGMYAAVEENFGGIWSQKPYRGYYDDEKALMIDAYAKMVDMDNRGVPTMQIKFWYPWSYFWNGGTYESYSGPKQNGYILKTGYIYLDAAKYESEPWKPHVPAWNKVIQQKALGDGNDPENFPGVIEVGGKLFKKSKQAMDKMLEESGQDVAFWGKGSTGGNYDKGFNPDHPDGTQQTNPFKPGSPLYNQFEKQRELQKMKDMGLMGYTGGDDLVAFGIFSKGSDGKLQINSAHMQQYNWYKQTGDSSYIPAGADKDALEQEWQRKHGNQSSTGSMDGQQIAYDPNAGTTINFNKQFGAGGDDGAIEVDVRHKGAEIYKYNKGEFEKKKDLSNIDKDSSDAVQYGIDNISSLRGLGAKDGDQIAFFNKETPLQKTMKQSQLQYKRNMGKAYAAAESGDPAVEAEFEKTYGMSPQDYRRDGTFNPDGSPNLNSPVWQKLQSKKDGKKVIATSYEPKGNLIEKVTYDFDKDPLVKKSDAFGNKEGQKTWFKAKDIKPEYPKKKPPKLKNGWHPKSPWHEMSDRAKKIKVSSQDLIRNYKVSTTEIAQYHALVDIINKFIDDNPDRADYIAQRYPYSDPRLCELNFKLDRMMDASEKYVDNKFPENKKTTSRIVKIMKKNIELTDPQNFKMDPTPPTQVDYNKLKLRESATKHFKKPVQLKSWHKGHLTNA